MSTYTDKDDRPFQDSLHQALVDAGYSPRSYSGRGMFGKHCVSVNLDSEMELLKVGAAIGMEFASLPVATDSMGRGLVVYWPSQEWLESYTDDDEF